MKKILIYCELCTEKCKLRECLKWETCKKACANIMTPTSKLLLKKLHSVDLDKMDD